MPADGGSYVLLLRLPAARRIAVGKLGSFAFRRGYYLYVGSALRGLSARIARHRRHPKPPHWHIDYLRNHCAGVQAYAVRSTALLECRIARALGDGFEPGPPRFGASDCRCPTHLFCAGRRPKDAEMLRILSRFTRRSRSLAKA